MVPTIWKALNKVFPISLVSPCMLLDLFSTTMRWIVVTMLFWQESPYAFLGTKKEVLKIRIKNLCVL
jgi:hypothetical protein